MHQCRIMQQTQAVLDEARKLEAAEAALAAMRRKRKRQEEGVIVIIDPLSITARSCA